MKDLVRLCLYFITLSSFSLKGSFCFFLKHSSGRCIRSASKPYLSTERAKLWYLELTNDCTDPGAQFRFVNDGVLHHTSSTGCVLPSDGKSLPSVGTKLVVFAAKDVCTNKSSQAYTQTQFGSLRHASLKCIQPHRSFTSVPRAGAQIEYTAVCNETLQNFMLGSVTCEGNKARNINCPASQVVKITKANYGGYGSIKTCGYNRNYNCLLPSSLCNVKRQCDGFQSCEVKASMSEFQHDACPGMKKYLYLEYECVDRSEFKKENMIIKKVRLAADSTPGHGYVELLEESEPNVWQRLCREDMKDTEKEVICRTLGYSGLKEEQSSVGSGQEVGEDLKMPVLHGNVYCNSHDTNVSSCCLQKVNSEESACSMMARVACAICVEPVLSGDNHPPVVFTASSSLPSHSADKAAMTSGSTWCARGTGDDARDHLKIDLSDTYVITQLAMLGDEPRGNWVESYEVLYFKDKSDWLPGIANGQNLLTGNSASDELSTVVFDAAIHARFIKIFPKSWRGRACLKLEICGHRLLPAAPINITLSSITAYTAGLTWIKPADTGDGSFTEYQISLFRDETLDSNKTTKSGWWHFETLRPYTQYTVAIQAGNEHDFGRKAELTFKTNSTAPTAPPMNIKLSPISSTALSISWKPPPPVHRNGIITGYEVCFARVGSDEPCDRVIRTTASSIRVGYLWPTTEYKLRVFARNDAGSGNYSDEYLQITNSEAPVCNRSSISKEMFIVKLQKPREEVRFCQVIVTALQSEGSFPGQELYSAEAVTYLEASGSAPGPYIAAEFLASDFEEYQNFTIGDRTMFPALSSVDTLKRSQAKKYFNGPLTANTRYTLFQRFFSDKKLLYSSDFLAPVKTVSKVSKATETNIQAQSENSSVTSFKVPFILMTVSTIILLLIIACFLLLKWRQRRQHATGKTKDKTERSTTDEKIPMNDIKDNNNEQTTETA